MMYHLQKQVMYEELALFCDSRRDVIVSYPDLDLYGDPYDVFELKTVDKKMTTYLEYTDMETFSWGYTGYCGEGSKHSYLKYTYNGKIIVVDSITGKPEDGAYVIASSKVYYLVSLDGKILIHEPFERIWYMKDRLFKLRNTDGHCGIANSHGEIIVSVVFDELLKDKAGLTFLSLGSKRYHVRIRDEKVISDEELKDIKNIHF
jgi:hypothetical protein